MDEQEIKAAGHFLGFSNLGLEDDRLRRKVLQYTELQQWNEIIDIIDTELMRLAESDRMYHGMMDEINEWINFMKTDESTISMWKDFKVKGINWFMLVK